MLPMFVEDVAEIDFLDRDRLRRYAFAFGIDRFQLNPEDPDHLRFIAPLGSCSPRATIRDRRRPLTHGRAALTTPVLGRNPTANAASGGTLPPWAVERAFRRLPLWYDLDGLDRKERRARLVNGRD